MVRLSSWLLLIFLALLWGSSFVLIKEALEVFSPIQLAALRIGLASLAFLPFFFREAKKISRRDWKFLLIVGLTGNGIPAFCYAIAETHISSITTGILNSLTPLFTLLLGIFIFGVKGTMSKLFGVLVGLVGAILLMLQGEGSISTNVLYSSIVIVGTICYATSGNVVKSKLTKLSSLTISAVSLGLVGPIAWVVLLFSDIHKISGPAQQIWMSSGAVIFLSLVSTVIASLIYYKLVQDTDALFASMVGYLIPITALVLGLVIGESAHWQHLVGMLLILVGVYLTQRRKKVNPSLS